MSSYDLFQMLAKSVYYAYYYIPSTANVLTNDFLLLSWRHSYAIQLNDDSLIHLPKQWPLSMLNIDEMTKGDFSNGK